MMPSDVAAARRRSNLGLVIERLRGSRLGVVGLAIIVAYVLVAIAAPAIAQQDPLHLDPTIRLQPPSKLHWFGTDQYGRDLFSRVVYGARYSVYVGAATAIASCVVGSLIGLHAAYYSKLDGLLMRIADAFMSLPEILIAIALMSVLGADTKNVVIAVTASKAPAVARVVRSSALGIKERTFVDAARSQGLSSSVILWRHIYPNTLSVLTVQLSYVFALAIILEAALSFLGAGIPAPLPSWGSTLYDGKGFLNVAPWMVVFPAIALSVCVLGANFLGDGLRDVFDKRNVL